MNASLHSIDEETEVQRAEKNVPKVTQLGSNRVRFPYLCDFKNLYPWAVVLGKYYSPS